MNHIQFVAISQTEADIINRHGMPALGKPDGAWWKSAEARTFADLGPNEVDIPDGHTYALLLTSLGIESTDSITLVMRHEHLAMAASRFAKAHITQLLDEDDAQAMDDLMEAMSEAVCASLVNYCTHVLITIN